MKIFFPQINQKEFEYAIECLESNKQSDAADYGFNYPYFAPGGVYGKQWWSLDSALTFSGYKWVDRRFVETMLVNLIETQKEDGRICLWGHDVLPERVAGNDAPKQSKGVSSLPKIFDAAYHVLQGTTDSVLISKTYTMLKKYLDWWYRDRFDPKTGLLTATFEETFIPYLGYAMEYAPVDTNVEVYVGLTYTAAIAERLKKSEEADEFRKKAEALKSAINNVLWDEDKGAYYPYDIRTGEHVDCLMASTFYPLRMNIASEKQKETIITLLKDDAHFNWNTIPLTSVSQKDPIFQVTDGDYIGNASWSGNVWTLINEMVVRGLLDCGQRQLAAELALKTIYAFNNNYTEFINPFDGTGHGVKIYSWSASQYLELIIDVIFGIRVNAVEKEIDIAPNLTENLKHQKLSITGIMVFDGVYLDVCIDQGEIHYTVSENNIRVKACPVK